MNKNENDIYQNGEAPEDTGEDFAATAFAALLEDMAKSLPTNALHAIADLANQPE